MKKSGLVIVAAAIILMFSVGGAAAGNLKALLAEAGQKADQGQVEQAATALRRALAEVWAINPITVRRSMLVAGSAGGFGQYQPRTDNVYRPGEPILIYAEPAGYRFTRQGEIYSFGFSADFALLTADGKVLAGQKGFRSWRFNSREPLFEVFVNLTYNLTGAPVGSYVIQTTLTDLNGGGQVSFQSPIVIK